MSLLEFETCQVDQNNYHGNFPPSYMKKLCFTILITFIKFFFPLLFFKMAHLMFYLDILRQSLERFRLTRTSLKFIVFFSFYFLFSSAQMSKIFNYSICENKAWLRRFGAAKSCRKGHSCGYCCMGYHAHSVACSCGWFKIRADLHKRGEKEHTY